MLVETKYACAKDIWTEAEEAFEILDRIRPNPKGIQTSTMKIEVALDQRNEPFFSATDTSGQEYCFACWLPEGKDLFDAYYDYSQLGLSRDNLLQTELGKKGVGKKIEKLEGIREDEQFRKLFSKLMEQEDVLVRGPLPPTLESVVKGRGTAVWMPKNLFLLLPQEYREIR